MRTAPAIVAAILALAPASADTAVDRLARRLAEASLASLDDWRASPDIAASKLEGDRYAEASFDDSGWSPLRLDQRLHVDSCWIRKRVVLPSYVLGRPVRGRVRLVLSVDDYGFLWVNGESRGRFPWDGDFELTADAKPGDAFVVAIKAVNTGGPLRLIRAGLRFEGENPLEGPVSDFVLSLRVGQKLLGHETYQTNATRREDPGIDRSRIDPDRKRRLDALLQDIASRVDADALERGDRSAFEASLAAARARLGPIRDFAREFILHLDANAHIDAAWLWREAETVRVCRNTFSSVLRMFRERPDFTYTQSSAAYYDWMERLEPDLFREIGERVRGGRWAPVGGTWIEPDCNLPSGESWARQILYGKRFFRRALGVDVTLGWNPDSFGYHANLPQIYRNAGIDTFVTQKIGWNESNVFPHRLFWWESPDGSRVLTCFPFNYVDSLDDPFRLVDWLRQFEANTGFRRLLVLFGVGDHGGGPSLEMLARADRLRNLDVFPTIEYGTAGRYLDWLRRENLRDLPVWRDELYLEYHQGTFTTQAKVKELNRRSESMLTGAEKLASLAGLAGEPYPAGELQEAWRHVMFNQFHDILPGSSIREVYVDALDRYRDARVIAERQQRLSLEALARLADTTALSRGRPILVFNTSSWERRDPVRFPLEEGDETSYAVYDVEGRPLPSQAVRTGRYSREILFLPTGGVPSMGYAAFELRPGNAPDTGPALRVADTVLENDLLRVEVDPSTGWLRSVLDKRSGRETLAGPGNELQLLEDRPSAWDAWNIGLTGVRYPTTLRSIQVVERGPIRAVIRVTHDFLKPGVKKEFPTEDFPSSFFTQDIVLHAGSDRLDFVTSVDWWEEKTMLKVAFPVAVTADEATFEIPYGTIRRSTRLESPRDRARVEVPALRWADLSGGPYGVSLLNDSKYGYDVKGNTLRLSLLRSPVWPDPTADRGRHEIRYALFPHAGDWRQAGTVRRGLELNEPLRAFATDPHVGRLPPRHSFVRIAPDHLVLSEIKRSEDSPAWIVRWYDSTGDGGTAEIELPFRPARAVVSDLLEGDHEEVPADGSRLRVPTRKHGVMTLKVMPPGP